ncbi:MAG: hypothetical protein ABIH66_05485 [bacterium]
MLKKRIDVFLFFVLAFWLMCAVCRAEPPADAPEEIKVKTDLGEYEVIVEKNIFGHLVTVAPEQSELEPLPGLPEGVELQFPADGLRNILELTGIVEIGKQRKAIIENRETGLGFYVAEGDKMEGFRVVGIGEASVMLDLGDATVELELKQKVQESGPASETSDEEEEETETTPETLPFPHRSRIGGPEKKQ